MRHALALLFSLSISVAMCAQTPAVSGLNDYWITPGGSPGGMSCKPLTLNTPLVMSLNTKSTPGLIYVILWSTCPCTACNLVPVMGSSTCLPPPTAACPTSNQFLEAPIALSCTTITIQGMTNTSAGGVNLVPVPLTSPAVTLSTQTIFFGPFNCLSAPFSVLLSQAWNVTFQ